MDINFISMLLKFEARVNDLRFNHCWNPQYKHYNILKAHI